MARGEIRTRMAEGAARLLATRGMDGTSFAEVLALTDSPRGSTYHHFPGGKRELVDAALDVAGQRAIAFMETTRGLPADQVVEQFLGVWRALLVRGELQIGCAVAAVTVATPSAELLSHAGDVFRGWTGQLGELLEAGGLSTTEARPFAVLLISAVEGAVVMSRAERDIEPFETVAEILSDQVRRLLSTGS
jgi:AcrR family transcriptional regulator